MANLNHLKLVPEELVDSRPKPFEVSTMSADEIEELVGGRPKLFEVSTIMMRLKN